MNYLNIALAKGRLSDLSVEVFESIGFECSAMREDSRKLIFIDEKNLVRFFLVKPADVPTYVEYGAADIGIVGRDTLMEEGRDLYEMLNLKFGACKMVLAGPSYMQGKLDELHSKRVATKYPRIAREYFEHKRKETVEVIKLNGSVELAPLVGLAELIVDLVESGRTLKENNLVVMDTIADISARLVVNRASMKIKSDKIKKLIDDIKIAINKDGRE